MESHTKSKHRLHSEVREAFIDIIKSKDKDTSDKRFKDDDDIQVNVSICKGDIKVEEEECVSIDQYIDNITAENYDPKEENEDEFECKIESEFLFSEQEQRVVPDSSIDDFSVETRCEDNQPRRKQLKRQQNDSATQVNPGVVSKQPLPPQQPTSTQPKIPAGQDTGTVYKGKDYEICIDQREKDSHYRGSNKQDPGICKQINKITDLKNNVSSFSQMQNHVDKLQARYECLDCGKRFSYLSDLKTHKLTHTGEKPHVCPDCGKRFIRLGHMKTHKLTHTGEKPHVCPDCGKRFIRLGHMKRHRLTHTGEKSHVCPDCGKRFRYRDSIKIHILVHTGRKPH